MLQEDEEEEGEDGEVPLTKKQVMDDLTAVFNAVMSHYRHPDDADDDDDEDDDEPAPAPLSAHALQVCVPWGCVHRGLLRATRMVCQ